MTRKPVELVARMLILGGGLGLFSYTVTRRVSETLEFAGGAALIVALALGLMDWTILRSKIRRRLGLDRKA